MSDPISKYLKGPGAPIAIQPAAFANKDYASQIGEGSIYLGGNLDLERAQKMGTMEQAGKFVGNTVANAVTGLAESTGHLYNLVTEWGDDRNYDNALVSKMQDWKNPFGEIYRENPEATFDLADPAFWLNHGSGLISSVAQFAVAGMGIGSVLGKGASALVRAGVMSSESAGMMAQTGTAALLAYNEGAMSAREVYKRVYEKQLEEGLSSGLDETQAGERAKQMASQGAASTAQMNTVFGTFLNLGSVAPMFRDFKNATAFFKSGAGKRATGESMEQYGKRLADLRASSPELAKLIGKKGMKHLGAESGKEGFEEVMNVFTESTGEDLGNRGESDNIVQQFGEVLDLGKTWDKVGNQEGMLNFMLGAIGGAGQTVVMDYVPTRQNKLNEDGTMSPKRDDKGEIVTKNGKPVYEKEWYSSRFLDDNKRFKHFENRRDAILEDISNIDALNKDIQKAVEAGDQVTAKRLSQDLMGVHHLNAILNGTSNNWIEEYQSYKDLDNDTDLGAQFASQADELSTALNEMLQISPRADFDLETEAQFAEMEAQHAEAQKQAQALAGVSPAMQRGFATSMKDNAYKERAEQSIQDLKKATEFFEETEKQFRGSTEENMAYNLVPSVVAKKLNKMLNDRIIQENEPRVLEASLKISADKTSLINLANIHQASETTRNTHNDLNEAIKTDDTTALRALLVQNKMEFEDNEQGILKASRELRSRLTQDHKDQSEALTAQEEAVLNSTEFLDWKKANGKRKSKKTWQEYIQEVLTNSIEATEYQQMLKQLTDLQKIARDNSMDLDQITKDPQKYVRSIVADAKSAQRKLDELDKFLHAEDTRREYESKVFRDNQITKLREQLKPLSAKLEILNEDLSVLNEEIVTTEASTGNPQTKQAKLASLLANRRALLAKITSLEQDIQVIVTHIAALQAMTGAPAAPVVAPPVAPVIPVASAPIITAPEAAGQAPAAPSGDRTIIASSLKTLSDLVDMHSLDRNKFNQVLNAYIVDPTSFPAQIDQTYTFAPQAVQAQMYQVTKELLDELAKNKVEAQDAVEVIEEEEVEDEVLGAVRKKMTPAEVQMQRADDELKKNTESPVQIVPGVTALRNPDGSVTIYISQGEEFQDILVTQKPWGTGFTYSMNEGLHLGEPITGKEAKKLVERYLADEGTSLKEVNQTLGTHIRKAKVKYQAQTQAPVVPDTEPDMSGVIAPSLVMNPDVDTELIDMSGARRTGSLAPIALHLAYVELVDTNGIVSRQNINNSLNKKSNLKVLVPGYIKPKDVVEYHVDMDALTVHTGLLMTDELGEPLTSPQDPVALLGDMGEVPIKITNQAGETIGHVMRQIKLNQMVGDSYANVDVLENYHDQESIEAAMERGLRSIEDLNKELLDLRTKVMTHHNDSKVLQAEVQAIGTGMRILNVVPQAGGGTKISSQSAEALLPDTTLPIALAFEGKAYTSFGKQAQVHNKVGFNGVGVIVPTANGKSHFEPLMTKRLSEQQVEVMWEVLTAYAQRDTPEGKAKIARIKSMTGFDVSTGVVLRAFMAQHYVTPKAFTTQELEEGDQAARLAFSITDGLMQDQKERGSAVISIGVVGMMKGMRIEGTDVINDVIELVKPDGTLNPDFEAVFKNRMRDRILQATHSFELDAKTGKDLEKMKKYGVMKDHKGLNSPGPVVELYVNEGVLEVRKEYQDYNQYLKANSNTILNGTNKVDGKYVYTVHPQIDISSNHTVRGQDGVASADQVVELPDIDVLDPATQKNPLYLQLEELRAATPGTTRSVDSVIIELQSHGLTELPDWMGNPFEDC